MTQNTTAFLEGVIKKDIYQVLLLTCPANMPFSFAVHPWFIINRKGTVSRWEVIFSLQNRNLSFGHLNKNLFPPFQGIEIFPYLYKYLWQSTVLFSIEGDEKSVAAQMAKFIEESHNNYPHKEKYSFIGPNSNTYVQWVLNHFPESNMYLPWNAFGKGVADGITTVIKNH